MKTLKIVIILQAILSLVLWGYPARAQQEPVMESAGGKVISAFNPGTKWVNPSQMKVAVENVTGKDTEQTAQAVSTVKNFAVDKVADELASLKYGETSDAAYTDLGGIKARQADIFSGSSDCLDRSVYLFNVGKELGLNPTMYILYDSATGKGHSVVEMDDGAGGRVLYDLTSGSQPASLSDYTSRGYTVTARVDSLEQLTGVVSGINGAYNIADDSGDGGDGGNGGDSGDTGSWGDSRNDGGGMGSYSNDGYGGYSGGDGSSSSSSYSSDWSGDWGSDSGYSDFTSSVGSFFSAMNSGDWGSMVSSFSSMSSSFSSFASTGSWSSGSSASDFGISNYASNLGQNLFSGNFFQASQDMINLSNSVSTFNSFQSLNNSASQLGLDIASGNFAALGQDSINFGKSQASFSSDLSRSASFSQSVNNAQAGTQAGFYGQTWGDVKAAPDGKISVTQNWVGTDGKTHSEETMKGTVDSNNHYEMYDSKGNLASSGTWGKDVAQNIANNMYDPGHQVVVSANGDKRDIDLSDGSYTIRGKDNQQVGSGSVGALDITYNRETGRVEAAVNSNLQVYAVDLANGRDGVPNQAASLLMSLPGDKPSDWTYTSSKDNVSFYQNVYTGQTIQLVDQRQEASGQYSWKDSQGNVISTVNISLPATAKEQQALEEKLTDPNYGKYDTKTDLLQERLGLNSNPKNIVELENLLKGIASQAGADIKQIVSTSGISYVDYVRDDKTNEVKGENIYTFQNDGQKPEAGKVEVYALDKNNDMVYQGAVAIDENLKYTDIPAQVQNSEYVITPVADPRDVDPYYYVRNPAGTAQINENSSAQNGLLALAPTIGLTDIVVNNSARNQTEYDKDPAGYPLLKDFIQKSLQNLYQITSFYAEGQNSAIRATRP